MSKAVFGTLSTHTQAERVVGELHRAGIVPNDISVLFPEKKDTAVFAAELSTRVPEGAAIGAATGGSAGAWLGGGLGLLTGLGAIVIPGIGAAIGPLVGLLSGVALGGAVGGTVGALTGVLVTMGIPEPIAKVYEARLTEGRILVAVHTEDRAQQWQAAEVLRKVGAEDVSYLEEKLAVQAPPPPA